jgi:hypothetical protein
MALSTEAQQQELKKRLSAQRGAHLHNLFAGCQALSSSPAYPLQRQRLCGPEELQISRDLFSSYVGKAAQSRKTHRRAKLDYLAQRWRDDLPDQVPHAAEYANCILALSGFPSGPVKPMF